MTLLVALFYNVLYPYWDALRRPLIKKGYSPVGITHASNIIGHPIGIALLVLIGMFALPQDHSFYFFWILVVIIGALSHTLAIWALRDGSFFVFEVVSKLSFLTTSLAAVVFLGNHLSYIQVGALGLATLGTIALIWPHHENRKITWDRSVGYAILSILVGSISTICYKLAVLRTHSFGELLTGRFAVDLVVWTVVWLTTVSLINRKHPVREMDEILHEPNGWRMAIGLALSGLAGAWVIYVLSVPTLAMLNTLSIPSAYLWSHYKYKERLGLGTWLGTISIVAAIFIFLWGR